MKSKNNPVMKGATGMFDDMIVFRQRSGKTIMARKPVIVKEPSAARIVTNARFRRAIAYANDLVANPTIREELLLRARAGQTAHNVAVADFMKPPAFIEELTWLMEYNRQPGSFIRVSVSEPLKTIGVKVVVTDSEGTEIESGNASPENSALDWRYVLTSAHPATKVTVKFSAWDRAGNITHLEVQPGD